MSVRGPRLFSKTLTTQIVLSSACQCVSCVLPPQSWHLSGLYSWYCCRLPCTVQIRSQDLGGSCCFSFSQSWTICRVANKAIPMSRPFPLGCKTNTVERWTNSRTSVVELIALAHISLFSDDFNFIIPWYMLLFPCLWVYRSMCLRDSSNARTGFCLRVCDWGCWSVDPFPSPSGCMAPSMVKTIWPWCHEWQFPDPKGKGINKHRATTTVTR